MCFLFLLSHQIFYSWACEMEKRRANLFTANSTPAGRPHCLLCVLCVAVCTHHLHLLRLFESNSLLRSYGDLFIYLFKAWLLRPATFLHFLAVFMLFLHYWSVKMKVRVGSNKMVEGINLTFQLLQLETLRFSFFFFFLQKCIGSLRYTLSVCTISCS